jgi:drug/metabolite transporter (DMT)-like permease
MSSKSSNIVVISSYALICLIWSSTWVVIKIGLESMPPLLGAGFRFLVASIVLLGLMKLRGVSLHNGWRGFLTLFGIGILAFYVPFGIVYWGQQYIPSGLSAIVFAIYPTLVAVFSHFFLPNERLNYYKVIGISLGFLGILVIFSSDLKVSNDLALWGMLAVMGSAVLQAAALILIKRFAHDVHPIPMNFVMMSTSAVLLLLTGLIFESLSNVVLDEKAVGSVLFLGTLGSVVTFVIYFWLLQRLQAVILSLSSLITPILSVALGALVLGEVLAGKVFLGAFFVFLGVIVTNFGSMKRPALSAKSD